MITVTLIPGDGIGPEISASVKEIFAAAKAPITWEEHNAGETVLEKYGKLIPDELIASIRKNKVALKGPCSTPIGGGFRSVNVTLRQILDLYANIRPGRTIEGVKSRYTGVDLITFRENTEGLYSGLEIYDPKLEVADALNRISKAGSARLVRAACEYARKHGRKRVTLIHKANILKKSSGLFLQTGYEVAKEFPDILVDDRIVDNMCMQLVKYPEDYDILAATNLFGDILSDLIAGLVGGLGVVPGANMGDNEAVFEAVHGSAPDIAGQNKANPTALLQSGVMMLRHLGLDDIATRIEKALFATLADPSLVTGDLGGTNSTSGFTKAIIDRL
ncbi:MAG TPA: NAD-dependent isocitrate dehydrogenase [Bacteroidetes bacterium]|nr:NAD-dependent isocitrate dehydrogenase [Bacteroidota bacterium]